ncbi:MAG TPA: methyltransferase [Propionicimonas sp.]|jgi:protein-S-isoprenylcysteine O-methyltransferase Ste14
MEPADRIVVAQAAALAGLGWPGRPRWSLPPAVTAAAVALCLTGGALSALGAAAQGARLTPRVEPPADAPLLVTGAYGVSRHPIYAGLLLAAGGAALLRRRPEPLLAWACLARVLDVKTRREEVRLAARFGEAYDAYRRRTPRLWPLPGRARG